MIREFLDWKREAGRSRIYIRWKQYPIRIDGMSRKNDDHRTDAASIGSVISAVFCRSINGRISVDLR